MKSRKNIVFLGMMGSGKSSIGKLVSQKLKFNFFDIDTCIEKDLGIKITEIFKYKGEQFFRDIEEKTTLNLLKKKDAVIALGGGAFMNKKIRDEVISKHLSFWLKCKKETILKRIKNNPKRPIAIKSSTKDLINLMKKRAKIYSNATYHVDCDNLSKNIIAKNIINIYETN